MLKLLRYHIALITFLIGMTNSLCAQSGNEHLQILNKFEEWKANQIKKGIYASEKKCNLETVSKEGYKGPIIGIPNDIDISYTDINGDNKIDAIVTFSPDQCDGGNALMNAQIRVLILSSSAGYVVDDSYVDKIEAKLKNGWLSIEGASYGIFHGTYYQYKNDDPRCCPSIKRSFTIDYKSKKLSFVNK